MSYSAIFIVRVRNGKEKDASIAFKEKAEFNKREIYTILSIENINSYIFVEGTKHDVEATCQDLSAQFRTKILGKTTLDELEKHLEPKPTILALNVGDIVEVVSGPFKGSTAKISSMTATREEIQIELLDSRIRIPIVIHADYVRKIDTGETNI